MLSNYSSSHQGLPCSNSSCKDSLIWNHPCPQFGEPSQLTAEVILKETETTLTHVERKNEPTIVLKLAFKPDHPVAGFTPQDAILSKGSRDRPPVRRGLKRKKALPKAHSGHIMPDAENRQTSQAEEDEAVPDDGHGHASYASDGRTVPVDCQSSGSLRTDDSLTLK